MMNKPNRILCAANRFTFTSYDGESTLIVCGVRHWDTIMHAQVRAIDPKLWESKTKEEQGFINTKGEFLSRSDAFIVATENNQIIQKTGNPLSTNLFSEDIY